MTDDLEKPSIIQQNRRVGLRDTQRGVDIFYAVINGSTYREESEKHNISTQRVRQIFFRVLRKIKGLERGEHSYSSGKFAEYDVHSLIKVRRQKDHWNAQLKILADNGF